MEMQHQLGSSWAKAGDKIPRKVRMLRDFCGTVFRGINEETLQDIPTLLTDGGREYLVLVAGAGGGRGDVVIPDGSAWLGIEEKWNDLVRSRAMSSMSLVAPWFFSSLGGESRFAALPLRSVGNIFCRCPSVW